MTIERVQRYSWRPAPEASPQEVRIGPEGLSVAEAWSLAWDEVRGLRFHTGGWGDSAMVSFDLVCRGGVRRLCYCGAEGPGEGGRAAHLDAVRAAVRTLEWHSPGQRVRLGRGSGAQFAMLALGLTSLVGGAGLLLVAGLSGEASAGAVPFGLMMVLGAGLVWTNGPGRTHPELSVADFLDYLDGETLS